jgi:hypothetical protein
MILRVEDYMNTYDAPPTDFQFPPAPKLQIARGALLHNYPRLQTHCKARLKAH